MSIIGGINLGNLTNYLFFFSDGRDNADWKDSKHGFLGDVAVDGIQADERTSAQMAYAGTIFTNDNTLGRWQLIVDENPGQAFSSLNQMALIAGLESDLVNAIKQINALPATPGFESRSSTSLDGLNTQNGVSEVFVINITSELDFAAQINITGDAGDVFILRWDEDADPSNGYQGRVKLHLGAAIVPHGGLTPGNFINVAGQLDSAGGGSAPAVPYPQGPRYNNGTGALITNGTDWTDGGFFTGYWLTTGQPDNYDPVTELYYGPTSSLSSATFVGGWYTLCTEFDLTAHSGGVYVSPNPATFYSPEIDVKKYVSSDNGITWIDANTSPGPDIPSNVLPQFKFVVTNTGNVPLTLVSRTDSVYGVISVGGNLASGASFDSIIVKPWSAGEHENIATVTGNYGLMLVTSSDPAHYNGVEVAEPAIQVVKYVSPDGGTTWLDANTPPGPTIFSNVAPQFQFVVTNIGNEDLTDVTVSDNVYGAIGAVPLLVTGQSTVFYYTAAWSAGLHANTATTTGVFNGETVSDQNPAFYTGVEAVPEISIKKYVSPDNGATWFDANTPPGPTIPADTLPQFKFVVTNTGNVALTNIAINDSVYGLIALLAGLAAGSSAEFISIKPQQAGAHENIATVTAVFNTDTLTASDNAWYFGEEPRVPSIDIVKYVSVDNGATWIHATTSPGPLLPNGMTAMFKYVITNTGSVPLTGVTITDTVLGQIAVGITLAVGESQTFIV